MITTFCNYNQTISLSSANAIQGMSFKDYFSFFQLLFGINAVQTIGLLIIKKSELGRLQFTANNTAQSLFVCLLVRAFIFNSSNNDKLNIYSWGITMNTNSIINTIIIEMINQLIPVDGYEIPDFDNVVKPMDY